jgi:hypothetical protein
VRTYPSHSSILYTLHPKHAGCEYPNDTSRWERFQASTTVCGHSICFRSNTCGQICAVELSRKTSIGRADPRRWSRAEQIGITEIKIEKGAILSQTPPESTPSMNYKITSNIMRKLSCGTLKLKLKIWNDESRLWKEGPATDLQDLPKLWRLRQKPILLGRGDSTGNWWEHMLNSPTISFPTPYQKSLLWSS